LLEHGALLERVQIVGSGVRSQAIRQIAPRIFDRPIVVPPVAECVAFGAGREAAWTISGAEPGPAWPELARDAARYDGTAAPGVRAAYGEIRELTMSRQPG
jgi:xylulokinase